jgi:transposase
MKQHANATLTVAQRIKVKLLFDNQGLSKSELARHFGVHRRTIAKWVNRDSPLDKTSETRKKQMVTPDYEQAVIEYRKANPTSGAIPIALALKEKFSSANRGTVALILKAQGLTKK